MNLPISSKINAQGHLEIGGCDVTDLAREFGTPLYVLDEQTVREKCREYKKVFRARYPNSEIIYASKALSTVALLKIIADEGLGLDVVSGGELYTARLAEFPLKNIYFHGNNKSRQEIQEALESKVDRIVIDNMDELSILDEVTKRASLRAEVLIRINPGIEAHTHKYLQTGKTDSKFGILKEQVIEAVKEIEKMKHVDFYGLHAHIGSQIFELEPYALEVDVLAHLAKEIFKETDSEVLEINIGGGLGVAYTEKDSPPSIEALAEKVVSQLKARIKEYEIPEPKLIVEPGRSIVAQAGVTLYTVGAIKDIPGLRKYVSIDGGMGDNPRPILYQAEYEAMVGNKARQNPAEKVTLAGRFCESGDILIKDINLPKIDPGDIIVVACTGAYNYSMASNYNRVGRPAMVLVNDKIADLIIRRETYEDLTRNDTVV